MKNQLFLLTLVVLLAFSCQTTSKYSEEKYLLHVRGSESMHETFNALKKDFELYQDSIEVFIEGGGSRTGLSGIAQEEVDIGLSSFEFDLNTEIGKDHTIIEDVIAYDGIVLISNEANPVKELTDDEITGIYNGTITDWNQLGGRSGQILPIVRDQNSGTQKFFTNYFGVPQKIATATVAKENDEIFYEVVKNPNKIGFVGFAYFKVGVNDISIPARNGSPSVFYHPTAENLSRDLYPLKRALRIYYQYEYTNVVEVFLEYLSTQRAQDVIESTGVVPTNQQIRYSSAD